MCDNINSQPKVSTANDASSSDVEKKLAISDISNDPDWHILGRSKQDKPGKLDNQPSVSYPDARFLDSMDSPAILHPWKLPLHEMLRWAQRRGQFCNNRSKAGSPIVPTVVSHGIATRIAVANLVASKSGWCRALKGFFSSQSLRYYGWSKRNLYETAVLHTVTFSGIEDKWYKTRKALSLPRMVKVQWSVPSSHLDIRVELLMGYENLKNQY